MKPNYFVIGSAKCGTTSLCALLGQHPDIFMTKPKEPHFFSLPGEWTKGFEWYESLYRTADDKRMRGEGSASYTMGAVFPLEVPKRIFDYAPDAKLIYIVRHPIRRIESLWLQMSSMSSDRLEGWVGGGVAIEAMRADPSFSKTLRLNRHALVDTTNYWKEIERYRKYFADDQILVLFFEDFKADYRAVLKQCFAFLGVDPNAQIDAASAHLNPSAEKLLPRKAYAMIRSLPGTRNVFHKVRRLIPLSLRSYLGERLLRTPFSERPRLDRSTQEWILELLCDDTHKFLEFYGRPRDYWKLEE